MNPPFDVQLIWQDEAIGLPLVWHRNAPGGDARTYKIVDGSGAALDLTGYSFAMQGRQYPGDPDDPFFSLSMAIERTPGFYLDDPANGIFTLTPPSQNDLVALNTSPRAINGKATIVFDIIWTPPGELPGVFAYGKITLFTGVTVLPFGPGSQLDFSDPDNSALTL